MADIKSKRNDGRRRAYRGCFSVGAVMMILFFCVSCRSDGRKDAVEDAVREISPRLLKSHVRFLAHDLLGGRGTGDIGFELGREYVAAQFERIGLSFSTEDSYYQEVPLLEAEADTGSRLRIGRITIREPDAHFMPDWNQQGSFSGEAVFVGYGLATHGRNDYGDLDVKDRAVFMLAGAPPEWLKDRERARAAAAKTEIALRKGAAVVIEMHPPSPTTQAMQERRSAPFRHVFALADGTTPRLRPHVRIEDRASARLFSEWGFEGLRDGGIADTWKPRSVGSVEIIRKHAVKSVLTWNIIGVIEGSDPELKEESVVFTAHLDHLGITAPDADGDSICNGAHDNALGVAKLLGAAEAMVRLHPSRSVVFAVLGAEEKGLLGSWHYVRHPVYPIERTVANINQDGGREGIATEDVILNAVDVSQLEDVCLEVMRNHGVGVMEFDRAASSPVGFSSDHFPFLLAGIPAVDLKPGHTIQGDWEIGLADRLKYYRIWRHKPADNFDAKTFTMESAAEMAKRSVWIAWHLTQAAERPGMKRDNMMWRSRHRPEHPYYFGKSREFD